MMGIKNMAIRGDTLYIEIDVSDANKGVLSSSKKSFVIASTQGNQPVPEKPGTFIGINVYRRKDM